MIENARASERFAVVASTLGTATTTALKTETNLAGKQSRFALVAKYGDMAAETIVTQVWGSAVSGGTSPVILKTSSTFTASAAANDNKIVIVNISEDEIPSATPYILGATTTGGGVGGTVSMLLLAFDARHGPITADDSADVMQIVA